VSHRDDVLISSRAGYGKVASAIAECQRLLTVVHDGGAVADAELVALRDELGRALFELCFVDQQLHEVFAEETPQSSA
jgi:hypothetical protein